jgi:3-oxoacyl-[acyl-carrier-protein] synthase-1
MIDVFAVADNICSPLGFTSEDNFAQCQASVTGIREHNDPAFAAAAFYAALLSPGQYESIRLSGYTPFEQLLIASIGPALRQSAVDPASPDTLLIVTTTKGNISLLETEPDIPPADPRLSLSGSAQKVAAHFGFTAKPIVASNACISGVLGMITALRLIRAGRYKNVVVAGADRITRFILSGFQSFQAISPGPCMPFDKDRNGISLGEAAATVVLSAAPPRDRPAIRLAAGRTGNDANHISGPSRTGRELGHCITGVLQDAGLHPGEIDFISAHGTATPYNDEMEAKALDHAGLTAVPVNSLKGYYGHTLGAAGLVESIITLSSMRAGTILPTLGFTTLGVSKPINVAAELIHAPLTHCLKTASGFGGCNAAVLFSKTTKN